VKEGITPIYAARRNHDTWSQLHSQRLWILWRRRWEMVSINTSHPSDKSAIRCANILIEYHLTGMISCRIKNTRDLLHGRIGEAIQSFLAYRNAGGYSPDTISDDRIYLGRFQRYLDAVGRNGGANWVAYHVATMLALHELFRDLRHSPVPTFCVLDQPSQVYFPRRLASAREDLVETDQPLRDEDIRAVRLIFSVISEAAVEAKEAWQAVVLDHADEAAWGGLPSIHLVESWRGGKNLYLRSG
jgi:hypothetical protein